VLPVSSDAVSQPVNKYGYGKWPTSHRRQDMPGGLKVHGGVGNVTSTAMGTTSALFLAEIPRTQYRHLLYRKLKSMFS
jgi:hypothetical protein